MLHKGSSRIRKVQNRFETLSQELERGVQENMSIVESHEATIARFETAILNLRDAQRILIEHNREADNLRLKLRTFHGRGQ